ncbi:MAG: threonine--tRNA ligase [Candidatus Hydrogenedentota bacterium]|nr:MAG: threonine--tRNA ligase [Candidatus Hydrogenedentota bacterium]
MSQAELEIEVSGQRIPVQKGQTFAEALQQADEKIKKQAKKALAVKLNGKEYDLNVPVPESGHVELLQFDSDEGKKVFWHSSAHVLAQALKRLYPDIKFDDGPPLLQGPGHFFYDVYTDHKITEEDFPKIEEEIQKIVRENYTITRREIPKEEAIKKFKNEGERFKVAILENLPNDAVISLYRQGEFEDLCRGPHVPSTGRLGVFKLTAVSGAYWKGDPANPMLQRIYGVSFPDKKMLKEYLFRIEEAKKRDHRKLGKELDLFSFHPEGPGFPFYHEKGSILFNTLANFIRNECEKRGYKEIRTPMILSEQLWIQSGHYQNFKENMYFTEVEDKEFAIKPMNCPGANLVYKSAPRSYRDLPLRLAELGLVHRHELSGVLHGLFRVRAFTQDDAHIYCTPDDLQKEIRSAIEFTIDVYNKFGFKDTIIYVATRPEKSLGSDEIWEKATSALTQALSDLNLEYKIKEGEGAFYGPKIEFNISDSLGRQWQCGTIQVDFSMPERFELEYIGSDGAKHRPVMVHRAILGSLERFMGILLEHYAGKLPLWLSPVQVRVLSISENQHDYANKITEDLKKAGFRAEADNRNEKIGYKIRDWNAKKINYALILGEKEKQENTVTVRSRGEKESYTVSLREFIDKLHSELAQ